jgi:hypothetical protein
VIANATGASITTTRATTVNNTRMRFFMRYPLPVEGRVISPPCYATKSSMRGYKSWRNFREFHTSRTFGEYASIGMRLASSCGMLQGASNGGYMQREGGCAVIRQAHLIAVVGTLLMG